MLKGGLMIRLIDIVFILLFGFIAISEIGPQHGIEPPKTTEQDSKNGKREQVFFLGITKNEKYVLETPTGKNYHYADLKQIKLVLEQINGTQRDKKQKIRFHICSNWDAPIKYAMEVAKICDNNKIPKSLVVRKIEKPIK